MKYKLIKKYPELGTVATTETHGSFILNQPEFWEEIIEKDYEILSFIRIAPSNYADDIFSLNGGVYSTSYFNNNLSLNHCLTSGGFNIYSVKRLPDGEVFTIGDTIYSNDFKPTKLVKITIRDNGGIAMWGKYHSDMLGEIGLATCIIKKPLFKTEDGVDIFDGNNYWFVTKKLDFLGAGTIMKGMSKNNPDTFKFSTKEKAEEFIVMNKLLLSINDIKKHIGLCSVELLELKNLVNSRLK